METEATSESQWAILTPTFTFPGWTAEVLRAGLAFPGVEGREAQAR